MPDDAGNITLLPFEYPVHFTVRYFRISSGGTYTLLAHCLRILVSTEHKLLLEVPTS